MTNKCRLARTKIERVKLFKTRGGAISKMIARRLKVKLRELLGWGYDDKGNYLVNILDNRFDGSIETVDYIVSEFWSISKDFRDINYLYED